MATNYSSPQSLYLHKGLPALHLGAPADFFDTRRLVSGCRRGGLVAGSLFLVADGLFLVVGSVFCLPEVLFLVAGRFVFGCRRGAFCYRRVVARHSAHKLSLPSTKSWFLCFFGLPNPRFRAFRAQNRGFCARAEG